MDGVCFKTALQSTVIPIGGGMDVRAASSLPSKVGGEPANRKWPVLSFGFSFRSLWWNRRGSGRNNGNLLGDAVLTDNSPATVETPGPLSVDMHDENWVMKILQVRSLWKDGDTDRDQLVLEGGDVSVNLNRQQQEEAESVDGEGFCEDDGMAEFDKESFSKLLRKVPLSEAKVYAELSNLGNLAYCIPRMKETNTLARYGFHYVTSSFDQRGVTDVSNNHELPPDDLDTESVDLDEEEGSQIGEEDYQCPIRTSAAYNAVASAASYLYLNGNDAFPFKSSIGNSQFNGFLDGGDVVEHRDMASFMATTDSVTAVVAAREEIKQAVADDLSSPRSSPCEWYICDDDQGTRFFVIQGSETLESWKANLLFEPVQFEGLDFPVHRGIYEAAKGMYEQMLPEVRNHIKAHGNHATFRFTGHSLGGSLSLLLSLMLLLRAEVPASSLLPVVTFGAPSIMCGGDDLLRKLGLPKSHVRAITMHRDIVPRAFSCHYPNHVVEILKAVNGRFRKHSCLSSQNLLYSPMGEFLILQPDEKFSPQHHLLPRGSGLYLLTCPLRVEKKAQIVFMNTPHPLEILRDRAAYGDGGTIQRDHDMNSYVRCVRRVVRKDQNRVKRIRREERRKYWFSVLANSNGEFGSVGLVPRMKKGQSHVKFFGTLHAGKESVKRLSRLVASQHVHLLFILLLPARLFLVGGVPIDVI